MNNQFAAMSTEQLYNEISVCDRMMNALVNPQTSQVPLENRGEFRRYQHHVTIIETLLTAQHIPSIAEQDTTHYVI